MDFTTYEPRIAALEAGGGGGGGDFFSNLQKLDITYYEDDQSLGTVNTFGEIANLANTSTPYIEFSTEQVENNDYVPNIKYVLQSVSSDPELPDTYDLIFQAVASTPMIFTPYPKTITIDALGGTDYPVLLEVQ